ncbi:MAG TPA: Ohr family peroxiredoxin [Steroidobacteraceae bacterium]|jgi:Ohr subfamily peroxiredoxin|nr:Ohr family peroxiredoxin [Steroidobacteraceae bacterium]
MNTAATEVAGARPARVIYTARVHTTGGRDGGDSASDDRRLAIRHTVPGKPGSGTNPEQLFAAGWSACFEGAMSLAARRLKVTLPPETAIDAEVDLLLGDDGYTIQGRLNIRVPGLPRDLVESIVTASQGLCPYSKAVHGNISTTYNIV